MADIMDGFSLDELRDIGTRKTKLDLDISATDINRSIPYHQSKLAEKQLSGYSKEELKDIGMRRSPGIALPSSDTTTPLISQDDKNVVENILDAFNNLLGIKTR